MGRIGIEWNGRDFGQDECAAGRGFGGRVGAEPPIDQDLRGPPAGLGLWWGLWTQDSAATRGLA